MKDEAPRARWRFDLSWGELEVFAAGDPIPTTLQSTAAVLARLHDRFRPALLRTHRWPDGAYAAVWPVNRPLPEPAGITEPGPAPPGPSAAHPLAVWISDYGTEVSKLYNAIDPDAPTDDDPGKA